MWQIDCVTCKTAPPSASGHRWRATSRRAVLDLLLRHYRHGRLVVQYVGLQRPSPESTRGRRPPPQDVFERALAMNVRIAGLALLELERRGGRQAVVRILRKAEEEVRNP